MESAPDSRPTPSSDVEPIVASGLAIAMSVVLDQVRIFRLPLGGSVTLGSSVPIWMIARRYGWRWGVATGAAVGTAMLILGAVVVHPAQAELDYVLAHGALGLAGLTRRALTGAGMSVAVRFALHVLSGVVFFRSQVPATFSALGWSLLYNASYLGPDLMLNLVLLGSLTSRAPQLFGEPEPDASGITASRERGWRAPTLILCGLALAVLLFAVHATVPGQGAQKIPETRRSGPPASPR